ncbi:MAG: PEP-CTERM sorting domain-containing protein [Planctomycetota bacterium]
MSSLIKPRLSLIAAGIAGIATGPTAYADADDGAPHVAVVFDGTEYEFELGIDAEFIDDTTDPPTINLVTAPFDPTNGYATIPVPFNTTPTENDDLGFLSEYEGPDGGSFEGFFVAQLTGKSDNFAASFGGDAIFTALDSIFELSTLGDPGFDTHPTWALTNAEGDLTPGFAEFDIYNTDAGEVGSTEAFIGDFRIVLTPIPEPGSIALLGLGGLALLRRRR